MSFNPSEVAVLSVGGGSFDVWETVTLIHSAVAAPPFVVRFTYTEDVSPMGLSATSQALMQITTGDHCTVTLAGVLAFTGVVFTRQVYYDGSRHNVEIIAAAPSHTFSTNSAQSPDKTMEWKANTTPMQIIQDVVSSEGAMLVIEGGALPTKPFPFPVRINPGESKYNFLDRITRDMSKDKSVGISFSSNPMGAFVVLVGPSPGGGATFTEGENILAAREVIFAPELQGGEEGPVADTQGVSQGPTTDSNNMTKTGHESYSSLPMGGM